MDRLTIPALLLALGLVVSAFLIAQKDFTFSISELTPNIYVSSQPPERVLSVSGSATAFVDPDVVNIGIRIDTKAKTARKAEEKIAQLSNQLLNALKGVGLSESEINSVSFSISPEYRTERRCEGAGELNCFYEQIIVGYKATSSVVVSTKKLEKAGEIVDRASAIGENEVFIDYVSFTLSREKRQRVQSDLLEKASAEARKKAESIAKGGGGKLGKMLSASESFYYPGPIFREFRAAPLEAGATEPAFSPGSVEVSANVNIAYQLE